MRLVNGERALIPVMEPDEAHEAVPRRKRAPGQSARSLDVIDYREVVFPPTKSVEEWVRQGTSLGHAERTLGWIIGAWWNDGERYGRRVDIVTAADWAGPTYATCRTYGSVVARTPLSSRRTNLSFEHHSAVVRLPREQADELLAEASRIATETGIAPPVRQLRQMVKGKARALREEVLGEATTRVSKVLGTKLYGVIYADPPWRFEPRSRETGMDRSADNHYPTMSVMDIAAMAVPAANNCALFLWATAPMLPQALLVMDAWKFDYRSHIVWTKPTGGTGYWFTSAHELLLLGIRGEMPAPAPGDQWLSWIAAPRGRHSEKPAMFAELIAEMFPSQARLEMFARQPREGWDVFGNEVAA